MYRIYRGQNSAHAEEVRSWSIDKYLDVMESFRVVTRIKSPEVKWGDIWFKCSCKYCHIHACCAESILLSMILNPALKLPPKWSRMEPGDRKRRGRPTEKRVLKMKGEIDARPFPDKADPRAPLRVREMEWDDPQPGMAPGKAGKQDSSQSTAKKRKVQFDCPCFASALSHCYRRRNLRHNRRPAQRADLMRRMRTLRRQRRVAAAGAR